MQRPQDSVDRRLIDNAQRFGAIEPVGKIVERGILFGRSGQCRFGAVTFLGARVQRLRGDRYSGDRVVIFAHAGRRHVQWLFGRNGRRGVLQLHGAAVQTARNQPRQQYTKADAAETCGRQHPLRPSQRRLENALTDADTNRPAIRCVRVAVDDPVAIGRHVIDDAGTVPLDSTLPAFAGWLAQLRSFRIGQPGDEMVTAIDNGGQPVF